MTANEYMERYNGKEIVTAKEYMDRNLHGRRAILYDNEPYFSFQEVHGISSDGPGLCTVETRLHRLFRCDDVKIIIMDSL